MKAIVMPAIFTRFSSRVDGSLGFSGSTPELSTIEKCAIFDLQNKNVRLLIEPMDYATDGKVEIKNPLGGKTPSERLRGVLFVLFRQKKIAGTYDEFYVKQMETVIQTFKDQLEPET
jgi:hypothetical protein